MSGICPTQEMAFKQQKVKSTIPTVTQIKRPSVGIKVSPSLSSFTPYISNCWQPLGLLPSLPLSIRLSHHCCALTGPRIDTVPTCALSYFLQATCLCFIKFSIASSHYLVSQDFELLSAFTCISKGRHDHKFKGLGSGLEHIYHQTA